MTQKQLIKLINPLHEEAYIWAKQCVAGNADNAAEILQIVYLKILEGKAQFGGKSSLKTWLFSIIRYTSLDYLKSQKVSLESTIVDIATVDIAIDSEQVTCLDYKHLLDQLSDKQNQVLLLVFYHDMTLEEVAKTLSISIGTTRQHYARGKKRMKELIIKESGITNKKHYA